MNTESWSCKKLISPIVSINALCDLSNPSKKGVGGRNGVGLLLVLLARLSRKKSVRVWLCETRWLHDYSDATRDRKKQTILFDLLSSAALFIAYTTSWKLDLVPGLRAWNQAMPIVSNPTHFWNEAEVRHISNSQQSNLFEKLTTLWKLCEFFY